MNPDMQNVMSSYREIKNLVGNDADGFVEVEEEEEEEDVYSTEQRAVKTGFKSKKKKFNLGEGSGQSTGNRAEVDVAATPRCVVENCLADLTVCKKYHQRHRVCEIHAKAPVAILEGLRQRFCQQCSRFHELSEFDQTKRSCQKRLAGHNERRRKKEGSALRLKDRTTPENQSFHTQ